MKHNAFQTSQPYVEDNALLRIPQRNGYIRICQYFAEPESEREVGIVLPVGCGKSGLIALTPFCGPSYRT